MAHIEYHPENGDHPWWIIFKVGKDGEAATSRRTKEDAERDLPDIAFMEGDQWTPEQIAKMQAARLCHP